MQLFTHLLSSYLQGMGDFFSALGRGGEGLQLRVIQGLLPLAMLLEDYLPMTNSRVPPAMMSA